MIEEIRIYYESLEQAANFILPLIEKEQKKYNNIPIELIKLLGKYEAYSKNIAPIIFGKDPDILLTIVIEGVEYPILLIEFSNAVFTEDHELQRFDGLVAAAENNCIYSKISPIKKQSQSKHGGNIDFNYLTSYALIKKKLKKTFFHFDWECNNNGIVDVNESYLSCPKEIKKLTKFIAVLVSFLNKNSFKKDSWMLDFENELNKDKNFSEWDNSLLQFSFQKLNELNSSRTEWKDERKELILKLNRFGHAMDPERGMLSYYGTLHEDTISKMIFDSNNNAWYKDIPKELEIKSLILKDKLSRGFDFLKIFMLGTGLYNNNDFLSIVENLEKSNENILNIDLSNFLKKNYVNLSKALRTIFRYSKSMIIFDNKSSKRLIMTWNKVNIAGDFYNYRDKTPIKKKQSLDEDDVTYISVHNILKENDFKVIAASYPGAQADRVVLIEPGTGRRQQRRYIDIISYLPNKFTSLQENKGLYAQSSVQKDINELIKYKKDDAHKKAVFDFVDKFEKKAPKIIKIGVGFWANRTFNIESIKNLSIEDLDYFIYITSDRSKWYIWSSEDKDLFKITKGNVNIPETFEISDK